MSDQRTRCVNCGSLIRVGAVCPDCITEVHVGTSIVRCAPQRLDGLGGVRQVPDREAERQALNERILRRNEQKRDR